MIHPDFLRTVRRVESVAADLDRMAAAFEARSQSAQAQDLPELGLMYQGKAEGYRLSATYIRQILLREELP